MPRDPASGLMEPDVIINGRPLTFGESMTLRVAVDVFLMQLADARFRQGLGAKLAAAYAQHLATIERTMLERCSGI